jgi:hypothetical protein
MEPLDERYFVWLYGMVADPTIKDRNLTYWNVLRQLYRRPFVWFVSKDDNRLEDGKQLRLQFLRHENISSKDVDREWVEIGCSVLELMVAMSARLQFEVDPDSNLAYWFWEVLMTNIGLRDCTDGAGFESCDVEETLNRVIFRQYEPDGTGGFFPLQNPEEDQRGVELWNQMSAYVIERMAL